MHRRSTPISLIVISALLLGVAGAMAEAPGPASVPAPAVPMGTTFNYQGRLVDGAGFATGAYDFEFKLYDAATGGTQLGGAVAQTINVVDGYFSADLDFGGVFNGDARYLEIAVRPTGVGSYTLLDPRQALTPVPYALALPGLWTQQNSDHPNLIGGYSGNSVTSGAVGATIGGGGESPAPNRVTDSYGVVDGGGNNQAGNNNADPADAPYATVGGGRSNAARAEGATVGGGVENEASGKYAAIAGGGGPGSANVASGDWSAVGGGLGNSADGSTATVGGGQHNRAGDVHATVAGGFTNAAVGDGAAVGGGGNNIASAIAATVGGGQWNTASGGWATVPGGGGNVATGAYSFAAGRQAKAMHDGAFVWGDSTDAEVVSTAANQFAVRASGGISLTVSDGIWRLEPNATSPNLIAGYEGNSLTSGAVGATIGGGGENLAPNRVTDSYGVVDGGGNNQAGNNNVDPADAPYATVGGGHSNTAWARARPWAAASRTRPAANMPRSRAVGVQVRRTSPAGIGQPSAAVSGTMRTGRRQRWAGGSTIEQVMCMRP